MGTNYYDWASGEVITSARLNQPWDASGNLKTISGGFIANSAGNELIKFPATVASAVNEVTISNAATGNNPEISATGGDTDIWIKLTPKGTAGVLIGNGTVAFPALAFASDTNSGLYRIGADNIGIATNGTKAFEISSNQQYSAALQSYVFAYGSNTAITAGDTTAIIWTTESSDIQSEFDGTIFTAKETGIYSVSVVCNIASSAWTASDDYFDLHISKNNSSAAGSVWVVNKKFDADITSSFSISNNAIVSLTATNTLRIKIYKNGAGNITVNDGYLTIAKIA